MAICEKKITPDYEKQHSWESYAENLSTEFRQCVEEGLDVKAYEEVFYAVRHLEKTDIKRALADVLSRVVLNAKTAPDYKYVEPSDIESIKKCREKGGFKKKAPDASSLREKVAGAWYGRICGCLLGKTVEGIKTEELDVLLKSSNNYPMHRYIRRDDVTDEMLATFKYPLANRCYADKITFEPADDDTNYTVLYQKVIDDYGRDFTPYDVSRAWLKYQPINAYCTAERVAYCNFVGGLTPPDSAVYQNPFREWIGAQIRGDYFGYVNPGDPETAADMAWRDASVSHVKNGIYGEMFAAAMIACAAVSDDIVEIIKGGLSQIPEKSRLYEAISNIIQKYKSGASCEEVFADIHSRWDEHVGHDWCHTISNAEIVAAALLYGGNDYGKSICLAVQTGFDTDCNGATVGSVLGMKNGVSSIGEEWTAPINGKLETAIFGVGIVSVDEVIDKTMKHISEK
ncbi:MAG: ADP-ribosylglycohydrolase family protein [Clostridia bacterium]|nr:ADP-ribosylglycohydrolase family protein [Clostridia bacterium]